MVAGEEPSEESQHDAAGPGLDQGAGEGVESGPVHQRLLARCIE
jgi:hypothetical protein